MKTWILWKCDCETWILWKMWFWKWEFWEKCDFENLKLAKNVILIMWFDFDIFFSAPKLVKSKCRNPWFVYILQFDEFFLVSFQDYQENKKTRKKVAWKFVKWKCVKKSRFLPSNSIVIQIHEYPRHPFQFWGFFRETETLKYIVKLHNVVEWI